MTGLRIAAFVAALALIPLLPLRAQTPSPVRASSRTVTVHGVPMGEVLLGANVVMSLRQTSGGYTPGQRADMVATRLNSALDQGLTWQNVHVATQHHQTVLLIGNHLLVTADPAEARLQNTTSLALAGSWQANIQSALQGKPAADPPETFPEWTNPATKIVPILSIGTPGLRLGAAQVTGPQERVDNVKAVFQVDAVFQRVARIYVFVPSSELVGVNRVQGVAVTALLQYGIFKF